MFLVGVPLLIMPFAFYNIVAFLLPGLEWTEPLVHVPLPSHASWTLTFGDTLIAISVFILFLEVTKSIQMARRGIVDHLLSLALLIAALVEFLFVAKAATPTFFLFMVTCFVDLLSGVAFSLKAARPKVAFEGIDQTLRT
ncbi:MAG: hypothetical protein U1E81_12895 [Xanthobacteraceae bacterium]